MEVRRESFFLIHLPKVSHMNTNCQCLRYKEFCRISSTLQTMWLLFVAVFIFLKMAIFHQNISFFFRLESFVVSIVFSSNLLYTETALFSWICCLTGHKCVDWIDFAIYVILFSETIHISCEMCGRNAYVAITTFRILYLFVVVVVANARIIMTGVWCISQNWSIWWKPHTTTDDNYL